MQTFCYYLIVTFPPADSNNSLAFVAASLLTFSSTGFGAPSTRSFASFRLNMDYFNYATGLTMTNNKFAKLFNIKRREPENELSQIHMDIAASIQAVTEEIVLKITRFLFKEFKIPNLCMAGGVALNCVANGKILKDGLFKNIWIQPASGDAGGALGAAQALASTAR